MVNIASLDPSGSRKEFLMYRSPFFASSLAVLVALLLAGPTLSALRIGTKNAEDLIGTTGNDHITGAEGNDVLKGLAGNDTYFFADTWGNDTLVEKPAQGTDTLNFRGVRTGAVTVLIIRQWRGANPTNTSASGPGGTIAFTSADNAAIEKVIGGQGDGDSIYTGGGPHTVQPGGGANDVLTDYAGWNGALGLPEIPASNDTYKGFANNTGTDVVEDWGGTDVVDLRPLSTEDVYLSRRDFDSNGTEESLQIVTGSTAQVVLAGHYGPYLNYTSDYGQQGQIETLIFADATFDSASGLSAATAVSIEATSGKQAKLAEAADRLAAEARRLLAKAPEPGRLAADRGKADNVQADMGMPQLKQENQPKREKTQTTHQKHHKRR
jgi:hypothetical protein